jgi:hypothetical protein
MAELQAETQAVAVEALALLVVLQVVILVAQVEVV